MNAGWLASPTAHPVTGSDKTHPDNNPSRKLGGEMSMALYPDCIFGGVRVVAPQQAKAIIVRIPYQSSV
ncbi:MAG TPA: hypothetical protein VGC19_04305 [Rhodanobacter sp.]